MTGFGTADGMVGSARVTVEIRSVNHRFFTPSIKLPGAFAKWEGEVRETLRLRVARGHVTLFARTGSDREENPPLINEARLAGYLSELRAIKARHDIAGEIDIASLLRLPDVLDSPRDEEVPGTASELTAIVSAALDELVAMRDAEGAHLGRYLSDRLRDLASILARTGKRAPVTLREQHHLLRDRVQQLIADHAVDDQRIAHEVAILAEKLDVEEEIDRFEAHIAAFAATIEASGSEPAGKRLGFLLQEMVREANTLGSKANDAEILADVILLKEELERIREQVENVE